MRVMRLRMRARVPVRARARARARLAQRDSAPVAVAVAASERVGCGDGLAEDRDGVRRRPTAHARTLHAAAVAAEEACEFVSRAQLRREIEAPCHLRREGDQAGLRQRIRLHLDIVAEALARLAVGEERVILRVDHQLLFQRVVQPCSKVGD
eukprot:3302525-Pleurochrysis_carterae.AAC.1